MHLVESSSAATPNYVQTVVGCWHLARST